MRLMDKKMNIHFRENLHSLMKKHELSLHQISKKTNINKSTLHNYLNGVLPQGLVALNKLSIFFNISLEELVHEKKRAILQTDLNSKETHFEVIIKKIEK
jgi:transcriptional regulator with XRE-family HTH domain